MAGATGGSSEGIRETCRIEMAIREEIEERLKLAEERQLSSQTLQTLEQASNAENSFELVIPC